jgi:hypothetical protein
VTLIDRLEQLFRQHPGEWIDGRVLAEHAGIYAWRSRCSDLRRKGLDIRNRQRRIRTATGSCVVSEYAYVPATLIDLAEGAAAFERMASC